MTGVMTPIELPSKKKHIQHFINSAEDVHSLLFHLNKNKSEGADEIHPKILASLAFFFATSLAKFYNNLLASGKIPVEWKSSLICAIYKKG